MQEEEIKNLMFGTVIWSGITDKTKFFSVRKTKSSMSKHQKRFVSTTREMRTENNLLAYTGNVEIEGTDTICDCMA